MILPDANLLLYAYNSDLPQHPKSANWWTETLTGSETVCLCPLVLFAFARLATKTRIFQRPLTIKEASAHVEEWLGFPHVHLETVEEKDARLALSLLVDAGVGGNLTTDAQIAAIALRLGATVHTADGDYTRFAGLRWFNPVSGQRSR